MFLMVYFKSGECARKARATPPVSFFSKDMGTPNPLGGQGQLVDEPANKVIIPPVSQALGRATLPADRQAGLAAK